MCHFRLFTRFFFHRFIILPWSFCIKSNFINHDSRHITDFYQGLHCMRLHHNVLCLTGQMRTVGSLVSNGSIIVIHEHERLQIQTLLLVLDRCISPSPSPSTSTSRQGPLHSKANSSDLSRLCPDSLHANYTAESTSKTNNAVV